MLQSFSSYYGLWLRFGDHMVSFEFVEKLLRHLRISIQSHKDAKVNAMGQKNNKKQCGIMIKKYLFSLRHITKHMLVMNCTSPSYFNQLVNWAEWQCLTDASTHRRPAMQKEGSSDLMCMFYCRPSDAGVPCRWGNITTQWNSPQA